jgi:hypothetical protein
MPEGMNRVTVYNDGLTDERDVDRVRSSLREIVSGK